MIEHIDQQPDSSLPEDPQPKDNRRLTLLLFLSILAAAALGYLFFSTQNPALVGAERRLKPLRNTATPPAVVVDSQPILVTFTQLNEDPAALLNRTIRVTGNYTPVELPTCQDRYSGPRISWSLIAENLQLDAIGYEEVIRIVPGGTPLTIEGTWQLYQGPQGCGKEPPTATRWYLAVSRIIQPNPLPNFNATIVVPDGSESEFEGTATPETDNADIAPEATQLPTTPLASTPELTPQVILSLTPQPTPDSGAATTTAPAQDPSPTPTTTATPDASATATPTVDPSASPTPTPTITPTIEATPTPPNEPSGATATPVAPIATATPGSGGGGGYPAPGTATPGSGYP